MKVDPGTYVLILYCPVERTVVPGSLGRLRLAPGSYVYVGSAFGPGGVLARVNRHYKTSKVCHWHIDYLRPYTIPIETWYSHDPERREHAWASVFLEQWRGSVPVKGFGASDCGCFSHLCFVGRHPKVSRFRQILHRRFEQHGKVEVSYPPASSVNALPRRWTR